MVTPLTFLAALPALLALTEGAAPDDGAPPPVSAATKPADPFPGRLDDAGMDQAWLAPTALTQPARSFTLHNHELAVMGVTLAPLERWQITVAGIPIPRGLNAVVSTKLRLLDASRFHLAVLGGAGGFIENRFAFAGAVASLCLDADCAGIVSLHGMAGPHDEVVELYHRRSTAFAYGASGIVPVISGVKLVAEINVAGRVDCANDGCTDNALETMLGFAGVRLHKGGLAATLGVLVDVESSIVKWDPVTSMATRRRDFSLDVLPAGSLSYRFGPRS